MRLNGKESFGVFKVGGESRLPSSVHSLISGHLVVAVRTCKLRTKLISLIATTQRR